MGRFTVLSIAALAAMVFAGACGTPQRVEVGELRTQTRSVGAEGAESVRADLRLALGELDVSGGADGLMEAEFAYNVAAWEPRVDYGVSGDTGELLVTQQGLGEGVPTRDVRNAWDIRFNDETPIDLGVQMGAGVGDLDLDGLDLTGLSLDMGAGATTVDLSGDWQRDLRADVRGGAGQLTMLLPSQMGVRVDAGTRLGRVDAGGLRKQGESYVNDAYGDADFALEVDITGGVGRINLQQVAQQEGEAQPEATARQDDTTTAEPGNPTTRRDEPTTAEEQDATTTVQDATTGEQGAAVEFSALADIPQRYYGQAITVNGTVGQAIEPRAFVMVEEQGPESGPLSEAELADGGVLVVRTGGPAPNVAEPQDVRVTGTPQQFDIATFEQQQGVDLDDDLYTEFEDRPVLVAAEVRPMRGEETTP